MDREQLLARIERPWRDFLRSFEGLSEAALCEPGVVEGWSVKDLIAHVTSWDEESLKALHLIVEGKRPPRYFGIDRFNAEQQRLRHTYSLERVLEELTDVHARLLSYLGTLPETWYATETRFRHRLRLDTYSHYPEHTQHVLNWRRARGM